MGYAQKKSAEILVCEKVPFGFRAVHDILVFEEEQDKEGAVAFVRGRRGLQEDELCQNMRNMVLMV